MLLVCPAGYVELQKPTYFGFELPWNFTTLLVVEVLTMGFVEVARNRESDLDKRCYPGGAFVSSLLDCNPSACLARIHLLCMAYAV